MPPKKRRSATPAQRKAATDRQWLLRSWQCQRRQNAAAPAAPLRNPFAASSAADSSSATRYDSVSSPANGRGSQLPIGPATVSTPVPMTERRQRQHRHSQRRRMGRDSNTPIAAPRSPPPAVCHCEPIRRTLLTRCAPVGHTANLAVPPILNEGTANLAPHAILNQTSHENMSALCRGVPSQYTNLADHPRAKSSLKLIKII